MNLFKSSILSVFVLFSIIASPVLALGADTPTNLVPDSTLVATVNINDAKIFSQEKNIFKIGFSLSNREGLQTGVKYGVQLIPDGANYIADEKVYDESLTLAENTTQKIDLVYEAPGQLSGSFTLLLSSKNESGFSFGIKSLGKIKLVASIKGIQIANESCLLSVEGEKGALQYKISQSVDIDMSEALRLSCSATNNTDGAVSVIPTYETRYFSAYGKLAPQTGGDTTPITFTKGEKKNFSILLPKGDISQFYNLKVGLQNATVSSNNVNVNYIIAGVSGSLDKVSLDKDFYNKGEKGEMSLLWSTSTGNFTRSKTKNAGLPAVFLKATISNDKGTACADDIEQALTRDYKNPVTKILFDAKLNCANPVVSATLLDSSGNVLDQKDFKFTTSVENSAKVKSNFPVKLVLVVLLIIIILVIFLRKKKGPEIINTNAPMQS